MKNTIFSNYYDSEKEQHYREFMLEVYGEDEGWKTVDDIPDNRLYSYMNDEEQFDWEIALDELKSFFENKMLLVYGTVGRWNGTFDAGKVISYDELHKCWSDCDYVEIYDEDGHMHINASHHDGNNHFEVKILTEKGESMWDKYEYDYVWRDLSEQEAYEKLWKNSRYTHIPHFAKKVYGCKTR